MPLRTIIILTATTAVALCQASPTVESKAITESGQSVVSTSPTVEKIDETHYRIGKIIIDKTTREIRFPAKIDETERQLEFLLVHESGKAYESLLSTTVSPTYLNLAFTLLRYPPSHEFYPLLDENGHMTNHYPNVPEATKAAARIAIDVEWKDGDKIRRYASNELIQNSVTSAIMPAGPWVYGGSVFHGKQYVAEVTGDIVSIYAANTAIVNYPGKDNDNNNIWIPYVKRMPAAKTNVTVIITPFSPNQLSKKP
jgi:hypothetical protein